MCLKAESELKMAKRETNSALEKNEEVLMEIEEIGFEALHLNNLIAEDLQECTPGEEEEKL